MIYRGHVRNGCVMLDNPAILPEGAAVCIELTVPGPATREASEWDAEQESRSSQVRRDRDVRLPDLKTLLLEMPDVGDDALFARLRDLPRDVEL